MNERTAPPAATAASAARAAPADAVSGRDREFLPAALEILETPPPPLPIALIATICLFALAALVWSFFGRLDVHAVAPGKIETAGYSKVIEPLDPGKVAAIHVEAGQSVKAGDLLFELDPAEANADARERRGRAERQPRRDRPPPLRDRRGAGRARRGSARDRRRGARAPPRPDGAEAGSRPRARSRRSPAGPSSTIAWDEGVARVVPAARGGGAARRPGPARRTRSKRSTSRWRRSSRRGSGST